jgi:hypothetical protein
MKKKILIGVGIFILILIIGFIYLNYRNRTLSPPGEAVYSKNGLNINISYSRPYVRGRLIFGTEEEGALLPYGKYWRLGANEATEITFTGDVLFNGNDISAGTYKMYAIPGPETFEISLNSELGNWGYSEPDYGLDILKTKIPVGKGNFVEQFTIRFEEQSNKLLVVIEWSDLKVKIPVETR